MRNDFAQALIACFRLYKQRHSIGSRRLYDAVNAAFCESALAYENLRMLVQRCAARGYADIRSCGITHARD